MTESERLRQLEDRLWKSADELRANTGAKAEIALDRELRERSLIRSEIGVRSC